jgi:cell filamentation protein
MNKTYTYVDPDYAYTDPSTGVLRNRVEIKDADALVFAESGAVAKRLKELTVTPIKITGVDSIFTIHRHLFQDIYDWAGKPRTVEISKGGRPFFPTTRFESAFCHIDQLIKEFYRMSNSEKRNVAYKLAELLDVINYLHPFREGNGRTQRELIRLLAQEKGWSLNLNPPDNSDVYNRYMAGTIEGDVEKLSVLIFERLLPSVKASGS